MSEKKTPFITVTVLCYNYGHLLPRALEAIAAQTFRDFDLVVINNGSTDNTQQVFDDFAAEHPDLDARCVKTLSLLHNVCAGAFLTHERQRGVKAAFSADADFVHTATCQKL